uniref:Uncharacterized protein n=1 Tax=Gopherus evgoodei TaxID=1825980 RepID=A0A8C4XWQ0_9SAUR
FFLGFLLLYYLFAETVELLISLKNYDPQKDRHFWHSQAWRLSDSTQPLACNLLPPGTLNVHPKQSNIPHVDIKALKKLKNKKLVKKVTKKYSAYRLTLGQGLNKAAKFPSLFAHNENMVAKVNEIQSIIKFQMKKSTTFTWPLTFCTMGKPQRLY